MVHAVTRQAQMIHGAELQHSRVRRTVRYVTRHATVGLHRSMFKRKWTLLIGVTFQACRISANCQPCLFQLESTMRIVAVATPHGAFENFVMRGHVELMFDLAVTVQAQLRLTDLE